jgi:DNA invertase Pin-like site-specific DNA recombinase
MKKIDTSKTLSSLDKIIGNLAKFEQNTIRDITRLGQQVAQAKSKGSLAKSITIQDQSQQEKDLVATKPYATFVEFGRGAITAQNKKALKFVVNGKTVFAKSVGPAKPRPFMRPAGLSMRQQAAKIAKDNWKRLLRN